MVPAAVNAGAADELSFGRGVQTPFCEIRGLVSFKGQQLHARSEHFGIGSQLWDSWLQEQSCSPSALLPSLSIGRASLTK